MSRNQTGKLEGGDGGTGITFSTGKDHSQSTVAPSWARHGGIEVFLCQFQLANTYVHILKTHVVMGKQYLVLLFFLMFTVFLKKLDSMINLYGYLWGSSL